MRRVEHVLRSDYTTYTTPHGRWTSFISPGNQKREAVQSERAAIVREITNWMTRTFPGFFASGGLCGSFPILEFWTLEHRRPFEQDSKRPRVPLHGDYMESARLGLDL